MHLRTALTFFLLAALAETAAAQNHSAVPPKREVRAVWLTTTMGLDWPRTTDRDEQQTSLREIVRTLKKSNFNTIFVQARARGDAYYRSSYEPWAENLTGTLGKDPGWDPLAFLCAEAHAAGLEVHVWFNVFKVRGAGAVPATLPPHPARSHPEWVINYAGEGWIDPGNPEARSYLVNVVLEIARKYDIDGFNFDYCRYPGRDFADGESYRRFGGGTIRETWRKGNIDRWIGECYDRLTALRPILKVGASPLGLAVPAGDSASGIMNEYAQDACGWLRAGKIDYVAPQLYWDIGSTNGDPDFASLLQSWQERACGRQVYAGIGAYKPDILRQITAQIDTARRAGAAGESFFRFSSIRSISMLGERYSTPAAIPPMPWKDALAPPAPLTIGVSELSTNVFQLEWVTPAPPSDGERPHHYIVYRWPSRQIPFDDPRSVASITTRNETAYCDTVDAPAGPTYYYAVSAVDRANNESLPSPVSGATLAEFLALKGKLADATALSASLSNRGGAPRIIAYSLARKTSVELSVVLQTPGNRDSVIAPLVSGTQEVGTYIVGVRDLRLAPGRYMVRLKTLETTLEQPIDTE